ncbi:Bug family tripartite tricarboxylate transporter substrate binding protein [Comamonas composti]|uniref:Bug family tripartite tricarboxylate transporter substrate binding protein n=1 Tax=Comamonas composti TaxID=408558 RepID=UPI00040949ED|nr:tripartite tricarboxylate transporter substrate binding protein [Comamonas composti]
MKRRAILFGVLLACGASAAWAQASYPSRPITLVVPFAAGSGTDIGARVLAKDMGDILKIPVIVENKPGANGALGSAAVARARPDGYTLLVGSATTNAVNFSFFPGKLGYEPRSFEVVAGIGTSPVSMYIATDAKWRNLPELLAYGKAHPGQLRCGSGNAVTQVGCEIFYKMTGIDATTIPYKSNPQSLADLAGGHIDFAFSDASVAKTFMDAKKIGPVAVAASKRYPATPEVPSLLEQGIAGFEITAWTAVFAPAGTPAPVIERLHAAILKSSHSREAVQLRASSGTQPLELGLEESRHFVQEEIRRWAAYVKSSGVKPE